MNQQLYIRVQIDGQWVLTVQSEDGEIIQEHNIRDTSLNRPQGEAVPVAALQLNPLLVLVTVQEPIPVAPQQQPEAGTSRARPVVVGDSPPAKKHKSCSGAAAFPLKEAGSFFFFIFKKKMIGRQQEMQNC